jgi:hypothetical protein
MNMAHTMIEALVAKADTEPGKPGYHIDAVFPDGSHVNAPIFRVGANWAAFAELAEEEVMVDMTGATITVDWAPGASVATGPRFDHPFAAGHISGLPSLR